MIESIMVLFQWRIKTRHAYNEDGEVIDTISVEEVAKLQEQAGEVFEEPEKGKRGRKAKEEKE